MRQLRDAQRPLLWLGHGIRLAGAQALVDPLLDHLGIPALVSWAGKDLSDHPLIFGSAGVYGGRAANHIVQQADFILAIGTRLSILQTGYDIEKFAPHARLVVVDIDGEEATKIKRATPIVRDAGDFMRDLLANPMTFRDEIHVEHTAWLNACEALKARFPVIEACHADPEGFISPYLFLKRLEKHLKPDTVIVTDSGGALLCSHQVMNLKPPQRLITTTGLGEMGFGLPASIGACFGQSKREIVCLNTDGGMMMNLQELQTIAHHNLPIKIIVFSNDGYGMIRHSQRALGLKQTASDRAGGVSCPSFTAVAKAFGIWTEAVSDWKDFDAIRYVWDRPGPALIEVAISPDQQYLPKLQFKDGRSPALDGLSPMMVHA